MVVLKNNKTKTKLFRTFSILQPQRQRKFLDLGLAQERSFHQEAFDKKIETANTNTNFNHIPIEDGNAKEKEEV